MSEEENTLSKTKLVGERKPNKPSLRWSRVMYGTSMLIGVNVPAV